MSYYFSKKSNASFQDTIDNLTNNLDQEGFGILTNIDLKETFKKKLNYNFRNYKIIGACNPEFAFKAIAIEPHIGVLLPCNIIVQEDEHKGVIVSAINPMETMAISIQNPSIEELAKEVSARLQRAVNAI